MTRGIGSHIFVFNVCWYLFYIFASVVWAYPSHIILTFLTVSAALISLKNTSLVAYLYHPGEESSYIFEPGLGYRILPDGRAETCSPLGQNTSEQAKQCCACCPVQPGVF